VTDARVEAGYAEALAGGAAGDLQHATGYAETLLRRVDTAETETWHVLGYIETTARYPSAEVFLHHALGYAEILHSVTDRTAITGTASNALADLSGSGTGAVLDIHHTIRLRGSYRPTLGLNGTYQPTRLIVSANRRTVILHATWVPKI
jgi:hypothetical protein